MAIKEKYPWEKHEIPYSEWGKMDFDWANEYKTSYNVPSYFFRYDNYLKGLKNHHVMKSTFGIKGIDDIEKEIDYWFKACIGAYTKIEYVQQKEN